MENKVKEPENIFRIKKSRNLLPLLAILTFLLSASSVYLGVLPLIKSIKSPLNYIFMGVGALGSIYFLILFFGYMYQIFCPKNALIVSDDGFLDMLNGTTGAGFIPWDNVSRLGIFGDEKPYIGIGIIDASALDNINDKVLASQIDRKYTEGKPELMIKPFEISIPLDEAYGILHDARTRYIRSNSASGDTAVIADANELEENHQEAKRAEVASLIKEEKEKEKSIDDLLSELSAKIGENRDKLTEGNDKLASDLEEIIKTIKENRK